MCCLQLAAPDARYLTPPLEICSGQASEVCIPKCAFSLPAAVTVPTTGATTKKTPALITWLSAIRLRPPHARMPPLDLCGFCLATWGTGCRAHRAQMDISMRGVVVLGHARKTKRAAPHRGYHTSESRSRGGSTNWPPPLSTANAKRRLRADSPRKCRQSYAIVAVSTRHAVRLWSEMKLETLVMLLGSRNSRHTRTRTVVCTRSQFDRVCAPSGVWPFPVTWRLHYSDPRLLLFFGLFWHHFAPDLHRPLPPSCMYEHLLMAGNDDGKNPSWAAVHSTNAAAGRFQARALQALGHTAPKQSADSPPSYFPSTVADRTQRHPVQLRQRPSMCISIPSVNQQPALQPPIAVTDLHRRRHY